MKRKTLFVFFLFTCLQITLLATILIFYSIKESDFEMGKKIAQKLHLTDLCLTTESRHTRNPAFPLELTAPFQDIPGFLDHFPSSTFIHPITEIIQGNEGVKQR